LAAENQMNGFYRITEGVILLNLKIIPGASKDSFNGVRDSRLCVHIAAQAESGKANARLRDFLSEELACAKRDIVIIKGEKSRVKTAAIPLSCKGKLEKLPL